MTALARHQTLLRGLARKSRLRSLAPRAGLDFASNDYLGLANSDRLRGAMAAALANGTSIGATGSRLLRGNAPEHEELEEAAAHFFRSEAALYFGGGYTANFAILTTLPQKGDLLILDERAHASAHEGARASKAKAIVVPHNDAAAVDDAICAFRTDGGVGQIWIFVESLYSMDGDCAPLTTFAAVADRRDAFLFIDEAHATGVYGPDGRGLAAALEGRDNMAVLHTCGKALGGSGAILTGPRVMRDYLVNQCRPFIYATAPSPLMAVAALEALHILREEPWRREQLARLVAYANEASRRCGIEPSGSQIIPVVIGDNARAIAFAAALQERGFDARAVRPPTVPEGTARLRLSITLNVTQADIAALFAALDDARRAVAP